MMKKITKLNPELVNIYDKFNQQAGSHSIASLVALHVLYDICLKLRPRRILEIGGGIGTISYLLLKNSDSFIDIYEPNNFCQQKLKENLSEFVGRYNIITDYRILPPAKNYELFVIDGGGGKGGDAGYPEAVWFFINYINNVKTIYVEGFRRLQRFWARKALSHKYIYRLINYDRIFWLDKQLHGGLKIECFPCSYRILRFLNFIFWEVKEGTAIKNFFSYRFTKIKRMLNNQMSGKNKHSGHNYN